MYSIVFNSSGRGNLKVICPPLSTLLDPHAALKLSNVISAEHLDG
jgi:hypothetical protein